MCGSVKADFSIELVELSKMSDDDRLELGVYMMI